MSTNLTQGCIRENSQVIDAYSMKMWVTIRVLPAVLPTAWFEGVGSPFLEVGPNAQARRLTTAGREHAATDSVAVSFSTANAEPAAESRWVGRTIGHWNAIRWSSEGASAATSGVEDQSACITWLGCSTARRAGSLKVRCGINCWIGRE